MHLSGQPLRPQPVDVQRTQTAEVSKERRVEASCRRPSPPPHLARPNVFKGAARLSRGGHVLVAFRRNASVAGFCFECLGLRGKSKRTSGGRLGWARVAGVGDWLGGLADCVGGWLGGLAGGRWVVGRAPRVERARVPWGAAHFSHAGDILVEYPRSA